MPVRAGSFLEVLGKQSSQVRWRWCHEGHGRMVRFSPKPHCSAAYADVGQGKMAKKSEPDLEPAMEDGNN